MQLISPEGLDRDVGPIAALRHLEVDIPIEPSFEQVRRIFEQTQERLQGRPLESVRALPAMHDPIRQSAMALLADVWPAAYFSDGRLLTVAACRMVDLSVEHGATHSTHEAFALMGWLMGPLSGRFEVGHRLAQQACTIASDSGAGFDRGRASFALALSASWNESIEVGMEWLDLAQRKAIASSDLGFACHCGQLAATYALMRGQNLTKDMSIVRQHLEFARQTCAEASVAGAWMVERTISCLQGKTLGLADFGDNEVDDPAFELGLAKPHMRWLAKRYWSFKTMLHYMAGDPSAALAASARVPTDFLGAAVQIEDVDFHFFTALAICAAVRNVTTQHKTELRARLAMHGEIVRRWAHEAGSCVLASRALLLAAEVASLEARTVDAERLYEGSLQSSKQNGLVQLEALSFELASRFYGERGLERISRAYLDEAVSCYGRWGAHGKLYQIAKAHPWRGGLAAGTPPYGEVISHAGAAESATGPKVPEPTTGELVSDRMIATLMRSLVEHAGAERAVLLHPCEARLEVAAEASTALENVVVRLGNDPATRPGLPESVIRYVMRTGERVLVDDASNDGRFAGDAHVIRHHVRSILCLRFEAHAGLPGLLYLENNLAPGVFTHIHSEVLRLLAAQVTVSLENARLYADLEARDYRIRRIFEVDVIGIVFWDLNGQLLDANDAFLGMVGHSREDLECGVLNWFDMTPPEWRDQVFREVQELKETGTLRPIEKEYFRKDGSRVPVLLGAATFDGTVVQQGVAIVVDLSKQKEAEARAAAVEDSNRVLHAELAHTNRLVTMGHLAAWIAHDVKQPLAGLVTSGNAGLRWLANDPPNIPAAVRALQRVISDGKRAAAILDRTRALAARASTQAEVVDVNGVVSETLALVAADAARKGISVRTRLSDQRPAATADRIQMQQVILNLMVNALEAMSEEGTGQGHELWAISEVNPGGSVIVEIRDTGPGLLAGGAEHCFEAFYSTKPSGLGMGLAIARDIVESFGGQIYSGQHAPRGAVFGFILPASCE